MKANKIADWIKGTVSKKATTSTYEIFVNDISTDYTFETSETDEAKIKEEAKALVKDMDNFPMSKAGPITVQKVFKMAADQVPAPNPIVQTQTAPATPKAPAQPKTYGKEYADFVAWLTDVKLYENPVMIETATAYADSFRTLPNNEWEDYRNLEWKGRKADWETFLLQAKIVGGYNEFNNKKAIELTDYFGKEAKYRLAREGSVAVYVSNYGEFKEQQIGEIKERFKADEVSEEVTESGKEVRIWWD